MDRYLNPKEKALYPQWLEKQEERRAQLAEEKKNREILSTAPPEETIIIDPDEPQPSYEYHLGNTVYIGADEYEILSFDENRVVLHDMQFPLFQKEMERAEFDRKVQENPMNDHLKVTELPPEEKTNEVPVFDIGMGYLGNGLTVWNRAVEENGDYQNIAHISPDGEINYYVEAMPEDVVARIEQAAEQEKQKTLFAASYQVGNKVDLDGKPFEITRIDDWNVELMDRSLQNPQPRLERKDSFMQLVQQNEDNSLDDEVHQESEISSIENTADEPEPLTPAFSQPKRSRVQTFDLHPDIPMSERHTFDLASHEVPEAGKKERFRRNMEAIRVLKECEFDNRFATPEEQEILSQYVGWGGIPEAFDENNSAWADEFIELYQALSPDEYESARGSVLTAFYTPPAVISAIYKAMEQMGFREGNILEIILAYLIQCRGIIKKCAFAV